MDQSPQPAIADSKKIRCNPKNRHIPPRLTYRNHALKFIITP